VDNQVRLQLFVLAYSLGNFLRQAVLPQAVRHRTLTTSREELIKIGAKVAHHSRQVIFQMAEVAVPRELFRTILEGIGRLRLPAVPEKNRGRTGKRACKPAAREENHEKHPRRSWARNQMGNVR
jgi:hypothetical protein